MKQNKLNFYRGVPAEKVWEKGHQASKGSKIGNMARCLAQRYGGIHPEFELAASQSDSRGRLCCISCLGRLQAGAGILRKPQLLQVTCSKMSVSYFDSLQAIPAYASFHDSGGHIYS